MFRRLSLFFGSTALAAMLAMSASAQEYSNGGACQRGRKEAVLTPYEAFGVHPPGPDPADANRWFFHRWKYTFIPYYAPLSPTSTSVRWQPWCYFPLMPYYTPYYIGYCPHRLCNPEQPPYGSDGWGPGPMPGHGPIDPHGPPLKYGVYTSVIQDDSIFWDMGGNGLVPYGTPRPPHLGPPDLVDMIQGTRKAGVMAGAGGACGGCGACGTCGTGGALIQAEVAATPAQLPAVASGYRIEPPPPPPVVKDAEPRPASE